MLAVRRLIRRGRYKAVIRASARARDPELAAEAQKGAAAPLLSTCACLINAAASSRAAAATLAGYADYESWRTLCNSLFVARATEEAFEAVHKGKARGHLPGPDTALHMLRFCGEKARQPEATMLWQQFQTEGLQLSNEHYNAFMESMIYTFGMRQTLQMQIVGTALPGMDTAGVNMVLDAMTRHPSQLGDTGESWNPSMLLRQLEANLAEQGCQPDALTHVLALEVACKMGEMDLAMHHFRRLEEHADVVQLSEERVSALLRGLSGVGRGEDLLEVLCTLRDEQLPLPSIGLDSHGQSLATSWLAAERAVPRDLGLMYLRHEREERSSRLAAERDVRGWRGPRLVMPPLSKMRVHELRAEAVSLGLDSDGGRKDVRPRTLGAAVES
jgi:nitroreductase